ncbi:MAG: hypothetical protein ABSH53_07650 [Holophaga sp.]|jgi:predicted transcriptional regulator
MKQFRPMPVQWIPTHIGTRWTSHRRTWTGNGLVPRGLSAAQWALLLDLADHKVIPYFPGADGEELRTRGLIEAADEPMDFAALALRARRNPLENIQRVAIEYTTACSLRCLHCRIAAQAPVTEDHPERLLPAVARAVNVEVSRSMRESLE